MKKTWVFPVFLIISVIFVACDPQPTNTPAATSKMLSQTKDGMTTYSDDSVELVYPSNWKTIDEVFKRPPTKRSNKEFKAEILLTVTNAIPDSYGSKYTAWCDLMLRPLIPEETREDMVASSYSVLKNYPQMDASQQELTIHGVDALEKIYRQPRGEPWYKVRDVWFFIPDKTVVLSCYSHPDDFQDNVETFQNILDSIQFK